MRRIYQGANGSALIFLLDFKAGAVGPRRLDISYPTTEFTKLVKLWEKYDESSMGIIVRHIKRCVSVQSIKILFVWWYDEDTLKCSRFQFVSA